MVAQVATWINPTAITETSIADLILTQDTVDNYQVHPDPRGEKASIIQELHAKATAVHVEYFFQPLEL